MYIITCEFDVFNYLLMNSIAFLGFRCPEVKESPFLGGEIRFYRSTHDCQHYYICVNGHPRLLNCGEGNAFNELIDACDAAENVTGWLVI